MTPIPKVNILYSRTLDEVFTGYFTAENFNESSYFKKVKFGEILTQEELLDKQKILREEWKKYAEQIFITLYEITGFVFKRNVIDIFIVRATSRTFSNPIVMYANLPNKRFMQTLIHEIVHLLISDALGRDQEILDKVLDELYPKEDRLTKIHIPVYAILALTYERIFPGENRMDLEIQWANESKTKGYDRAIKLAQEAGFQKILDDISIRFKKLKNPL